jgi:hypothetical protein
MRYLTKQERREEKRLKRRQKFPQHGKGLARVYKDVTFKRNKEYID